MFFSCFLRVSLEPCPVYCDTIVNCQYNVKIISLHTQDIKMDSLQ